MIKSLYTAATGMKAQQTYVDAISNNLANVNTNGFKRSQPTFEDLLYITLKAPGLDAGDGTPNPIGIQIGSGVKLSGTTMNFQKGVLEGTQRPFDVAITGDGFFKVTLPSGRTGYTRDGHLLLDANGRLTTPSGNPLDPEIVIPQNTVALGIGTDGTVTITTSDAPDITQDLGRLTLVRFINPAGLEKSGGNIYLATAAAGTAIEGNPGENGLGEIQQNFLERSNVEVVNELVSLIVAQRAYEVNSRAIRASDDMLSQATNIVR